MLVVGAIRRSLLLVIVLAVGLSPVSVAADESAEMLVGPNVVEYGLAPYVLEDSHQYVVQGTALPGGGCHFKGEHELAGGQSLTEIEVAYDPDTCRSLFEAGSLVSGHDFLQPQFDSTLTYEEGHAGGVSESPAETEDLSMQGAGDRHRAYHWSWYDEPARWAFNCDVEDGFSDGCVLPPVNTVRNDIDWRPDGTCAVSPGTTGRMSYQITWLRATGWTVVQNDWSHSPDPIPCDQDIFSRNNNHFNNGVFCQSLANAIPIINPRVAPTDTYYQPNSVSGNQNGVATYRWSASKAGGCESFLRFARKGQNRIN
jgi:hypothetical protein